MASGASFSLKVRLAHWHRLLSTIRGCALQDEAAIGLEVHIVRDPWSRVIFRTWPGHARRGSLGHCLSLKSDGADRGCGCF